jgi:hypothetical protein
MAESKEFPVIFPVHGKSAGAQPLDGFVAAEQVEVGAQRPSPLALPVL